MVAGLTAGAVSIFVGMTLRRQVRQLSTQMVLLQSEVAERERAELMLRQAQKMEALGQLTGGVSHDFNNMLAIIVGNLDLLLRRLSNDDARARGFAESALTGARRAAELTKRLLAFSRLQPLQPQSIDVNKCVSGMSELLRRTLGVYTTKPSGEGTGLGLSQVHGFLKQSKGHIKLYSEAGKGIELETILAGGTLARHRGHPPTRKRDPQSRHQRARRDVRKRTAHRRDRERGTGPGICRRPS